MKTRTAIVLNAIGALLVGATVASAADLPSSRGGMMTTPSDSLSLTAAQQKTAWNDLNNHASNQNAPAGFDASAGSTVPGALTIKAVPTKAARDVTQLRPYDFAMVSGKILIVNPKDRTVAEVLSG